MFLVFGLLVEAVLLLVFRSGVVMRVTGLLGTVVVLAACLVAGLVFFVVCHCIIEMLVCRKVI